MSDERRSEERAPIRLSVQYRSADAVYEGYSENISGGGVFIRTKETLPIGSHVILELHLPDANVLEIEGKVVYANPFENSRPLMQGMGIQFRLAPEAVIEEIRSWTRQVLKRHPEGPAFRPL